MNTPDLTNYRLVHRGIRQSTARLTAAISTVTERDGHDRGRQLARWYAGFEGELRVHHTVEDDHFFPALFERVPALRNHLDRIDDEHHELEELIVATRTAIAELTDPSVPFSDAVTGAAGRAAELEALMDRHLDFEDAEILPLFTRHMDAADYDEIEGKALATPKFGQLRFTVPWMMANANAEERRHLLAGAPFAMKVLWVVTRRGHDRLTTGALGDPANAPTPAVAP
jgi:hemerythrin-like domain-containing protein